MPINYKEIVFEAAIEHALLTEGGYVKGNNANFRRDIALDSCTLISFIKATQPQEWEKLLSVHGTGVDEKFLARLCKEIEAHGMLHVLRHGITDHSIKFRLAYFAPASGLNPELETLYQANVLTVTRQVHFSPKTEQSIDVLLSLNGLPVVTLELKNPLTGQTWENAITQYQNDRDPRELLFQFNQRALVHFAVDPDEAYMTTCLKGQQTTFLPFNMGNNGGKGNPDNPTNYKTAYLWSILSRESILDIIGRFMHLQAKQIRVDGQKDFIKRESLIFPRYHQLDCVRRLEADAKASKIGKSYLIQHSAGSGKSNSIAWLAHSLSSLHNADDKLVFNSIIVVTDRIVLDRQLQDTIYQFEHKEGVVVKVDKGSKQLTKALLEKSKIIITTLQKFPYVLEQAGSFEDSRYAVIIDEAHSSQSGESAQKLKEVLAAKSLEEAANVEESTDEYDSEDEILKAIEARQRPANVSFFAFTATPKAKTLEMFGTKGEDGKPHPFHLYSMRQAIEEKFILDVLASYTPYSIYYKLAKAIEDDPKVDKRKAARAIARFVSLHPHHLAQKTEVIIEHFRQYTSKKIGGRAKAMVITSSRLHAVKYYHSFLNYIREKHYTDIKLLVAFSGRVIDEAGQEYTEPELNGISEKQLPSKFATSDYNMLIVADKYQTGFDEPLLHTMYVDKRLSGIKAVQTLSRLNRTYPGKEDTFVLDFVNNIDEIRESFQPYFEQTVIAQESDPNLLFDLKTKLEGAQIYWQSEVESFCKVFFKPKQQQLPKDLAQLYGYLQPALDRFAHADEEKQDKFKEDLGSFVHLFSYLSQLLPFGDIEIEKLFAFGKCLLKKLPHKTSEPFQLGDDVALQYYRLTKGNEIAISLQEGAAAPVHGPVEVGMVKVKPEKELLSRVIDVLNEKFATDFTDADQLFFDQIEAKMYEDATLREQALNNTEEQFSYGFSRAFMDKAADRYDENETIFNRLVEDERFQSVVKEIICKKVYKRFHGESALPKQ